MFFSTVVQTDMQYVCEMSIKAVIYLMCEVHNLTNR